MTVNGNHIAKLNAIFGSTLFHEYSWRISRISEELRGSNLYELGWDNVNKSSISVVCYKDCAVVVALWENEHRHENLMSSLQYDGWIRKKEQNIEFYRSAIEEFGKTKGVFSKAIKANSTISFDKPENNLPISIFVVQGKLKNYNNIYG